MPQHRDRGLLHIEARAEPLSTGTSEDQHGCGIVVDYGVVDQLEDALTSLERNPELRSQMGKNARQAYEEEFQWSEMAARLIALYESILES